MFLDSGRHGDGMGTLPYQEEVVQNMFFFLYFIKEISKY